MPQHISSLPGEDPESEIVDDVRHWVSVYAELEHDMERLLAALPDGEGSLDRQRLHAQREHLKGRLRYWTERLRQLGGGRRSGLCGARLPVGEAALGAILLRPDDGQGGLDELPPSQ